MLFPYQVDLDYDRRPWATYTLLAINIAVQLLVARLPASDRTLLLVQYGYTPAYPSLLTMLTATFLHGGWLHLIGNMYMLWLFGRAVETALGPVWYVVFYLAAGMISMMVHTALTLPVVADVPCIGASGAIAGVLGAFLALFPAVRVGCLILVLEFRPLGTADIHAGIVLGIWFALQLILQDAMGGSTGATGVAYAAHIGGFAFGWVLFAGIKALGGARADWGAIQWTRRLRRAALRIERGEPVPAADAGDPVVQRMQFLKHGAAPEPVSHVSDWIQDFDSKSDAALIASLACRAVSRDADPTGLTPNAAARAAQALAHLGRPESAARLLLDRLAGTSGIDSQPILFALGNVLIATGRFEPAARQCMEIVVALDASTQIGHSAKYTLREWGSG